MRIWKRLSCSILALLLFAAAPAMAHLPHPRKATGVVLAVDVDTQCLVFKESKGKKPFVLDWNKETEFVRDDQRLTGADLKAGTRISISYRDISFHNPLLKKVEWSEKPAKAFPER